MWIVSVEPNATSVNCLMVGGGRAWAQRGSGLICVIKEIIVISTAFT